MTINLFAPLSFIAVFGSGIRGSGSEILDPGWVKIRIRDPGSGSATLFFFKDAELGEKYCI
jgi:hypothetical protein